jgi:Ser/Thr protein kinase RdoA (MazF antagonist)
MSERGHEELTADERERAARLRPLAERAVARYDLPSPTLTLLTNDWNCVFRIDTVDGSRYVLRIGLPESGPDRALAEAAWLAALATDGSVVVPEPVPAHDGSLAVVAEAEGVPEPRTCVVFKWLEGRPLIEVSSEENLEAFGATIARLHLQAAGFHVPPGMRVWDSPYPFEEPRVLFEAEHAASLGGFRATYERALDVTVKAIERLQAAEPPRMIHADLHEDNVFVRADGSLAVLDFDDCLAGWPVQDLGVTVSALAAGGDLEPREAALRRGYERVAAWPERTPGEIHVFGADTCLSLANLIVQDHDPAYREAAPEWIARWAERIELLLG